MNIDFVVALLVIGLCGLSAFYLLCMLIYAVLVWKADKKKPDDDS